MSDPIIKHWFQDAETDQEKLKRMESDFQSIFVRSEDGARVLTRILRDCYFFREARTEEEVNLNNFAKKVLYNIGIWRPENQLDIVRALTRIAQRSDEDGREHDTARGNTERYHSEPRWKHR